MVSSFYISFSVLQPKHILINQFLFLFCSEVSSIYMKNLNLLYVFFLHRSKSKNSETENTSFLILFLWYPNNENKKKVQMYLQFASFGNHAQPSMPINFKLYVAIGVGRTLKSAHYRQPRHNAYLHRIMRYIYIYVCTR